MRYAIIARDGTDPEAKARRLAVRPVHLERVAPFVERGRVSDRRARSWTRPGTWWARSC